MQTTEHGSAKWMTDKKADANGLVDNDGIIMGYIGDNLDKLRPIRYDGDQHIFTVAKNRSGKGTSAIIPALLDYEGGVFVIDVKGENALVTAPYRKFGMGNNVQILDPWNIAINRFPEMGYEATDFVSAGFNPLDMLKADSPDLIDDARMIADAIIAESGGDTHWSTEGKSALAGFIIHVVTSPNEKGKRTLNRVRDILNLPPSEIALIMQEMSQHGSAGARSSANQMQQKSEKELQSIISTVVSNTHFLDSPAIRSTLEKTTFDFADLKSNENPVTVYLVLPAERLETHGRWLRLLVSMALTSITRTKGKPKKSALFILDEFAALGRLETITTAVGLMAGFGMRIWSILQDMSQLRDLYPKRWQTFIANAGVVQIFGVSDVETAQYFSQMMGKSTIEKVSVETQEKRDGGFFRRANPDYTGMADSSFARDLMTHDELMKLDEHEQILLFSQRDPIAGAKLPYFKNSRYFHDSDITKPAFDLHPDQPAPSGKLHVTDGAGGKFAPFKLSRRMKISLAGVGVVLLGIASTTGFKTPARYYQEIVLRDDATSAMANASAYHCALMEWAYNRYPVQAQDGVMLSSSITVPRGIHAPYEGHRGDIVVPHESNGAQIGLVYFPIKSDGRARFGQDFSTADLVADGIARPVLKPC